MEETLLEATLLDYGTSIQSLKDQVIVLQAEKVVNITDLDNLRKGLKYQANRIDFLSQAILELSKATKVSLKTAKLLKNQIPADNSAPDEKAEGDLQDTKNKVEKDLREKSHFHGGIKRAGQ